MYTLLAPTCRAFALTAFRSSSWQVRAEGHDLAAVGLLQPFEDDRRVEAARVGQHDFLDHMSAAHYGHRSRSRRMRMAFCAWSRFSAWSSTTDCGPSSTSAVISCPRWEIGRAHV